MSGYTQVGPFNNNAPPAISKAFLDALETFLLSLNSASYDSNITSDGSGNITIPATAHYEIAGFQVLYSDTHILTLNCPNVGGGHKLYLAVGGVNQFSVDSSGNVRIAGSLTQNTTP